MARPKLRKLIWGGVVAISTLALLGVGGKTAYRAHLTQVTGQPDTPFVACTECHGPGKSDRPKTALPTHRYVSPGGLAVSHDGKTLYITAEDDNRVLAVDLSTRKIDRETSLPDRPHGLTLSPDGQHLAVASRDGDVVRLLDPQTLAVQDTRATGEEPCDVAFSPDGHTLFTANSRTDDVSVLALDAAAPAPDAAPALRLAASREPYALSASHGLVAVANRLSRIGPPRALTLSELTVIDVASRQVIARRDMPSVNLTEGVALSSDGSFALVSTEHVRNLLPITQVARGGVMNSAVVYVETTPDGLVVELPLDEDGHYYADPAAVVMSPDDRFAYVSAGGANAVSVIDVQALRAFVRTLDAAGREAIADDLSAAPHFVRARIATRDNPRALALSPDGTRLYVAERLADSIAVVDTAKNEVLEHIEVGLGQQPDTALTAERRGERAFNNATVTFQSEFSCRSCHPDGQNDGLAYDFVLDGVGQNILDNRSLRGLQGTDPFKWNGKNPSIDVQCGPRFALVLTRSDPFPPGQLGDLVTYIYSIPLPPQRPHPEMAAARERGKVLFHREKTNTGADIPVANRCPTCHRAPLYTNRQLEDVGTGGKFDTPHLLDIVSTAPYLHDGRAASLEEIWTVYSPDDTHGATRDLSKPQLNDLITYLKAL